ncbi:MAG: PDZ domain-containing protein, partial [Planctomycetota bacterium]
TGSPGEQIGLKQWDVVLALNRQEVKTLWEFRRLLKEGLQHHKLEIVIIRQGTKQLLNYNK